MPITARHLVLVVGLGLFVDSPSLASASAAEGRFGETGAAIAYLSRVEGTVTRLRGFGSASARPNSSELRRDLAEAADGREGGPAPASVGVTLVDGDQIVTAVGRAEITFADGSVMHLDRHTQVVIAGPTRVRLLDGRVSLRTTTAYTAETGSGIVVLSASARSLSGELRRDLYELTASANNRDVLVRVVEGDAQIESPWGVESVTSTQTAFVSGSTGRPFVSSYVRVQLDSFTSWSNADFALVSSASVRSEAGELRRNLAVAAFGRERGHFVPYAQPAYRQFAYGRLLRTARHDGKRPAFHQRADAVRDAPRRTNRAAGAGDLQRRGQSAPAVTRAARVVRGASKGAAVRQP